MGNQIIHIEVTPYGSDTETRGIAADTCVGAFLTSTYRVALDNWLISANREKVPVTYVLKDGDSITLTPSQLRGEAWVPSLRDFKTFLKSIGFQYHRPGKRDHKIWKNAEGDVVSVNPSSRDRQMVDIASVRQLAEVRKQSFSELISVIKESMK